MVYFANIQLDPEKLRNRQILLVSLSILCYYRTEVEMFVLSGLFLITIFEEVER